jgi:probable O-glycosylation ligase (exosortase A-associated)
MWVWLSVMNPHRLTWSYAYAFPFAALIAAVTLLSILINKDARKPLPMNSLTIAALMFTAWTGVTTVFAFYPADAYVKWVELMKTMLMVFMIPVLFHTKEHLRQLLWVTVLSVAYYGFKGGIWTLLMGGGERVWGPASSYIEDNNALAVATVMIIPLLRYLQLTSPHTYVRWGLVGIMLSCGVSVIGSHSRGALISLGAMLLFLAWKTQRKLQVLFVLALAVPMVLSMMPEHWYSRMDTIANYEEDTSALMRLNAWGTAINIANDRPLVGGGFETATGWVFQLYAPDRRWPPQVAHSIYFQALGEHGWVGLFLYLWMYYMFWRHAGALIRMTRRRPELAWARHFGLMTHVSLIAFAAGGAFLSLLLYDVPYYMLMVVVAMRVVVEKELRNLTPEPAVAPWQRYSLTHTNPPHASNS